MLKTRRGAGDDRRSLPYHDYNKRFYLRTILIGEGEFFAEVWDYSEGDILLYDPTVHPKAGDIVITKEEDGCSLKLYEPKAHRVSVPKKRRPGIEYDDEGNPILDEPEPEILEVVDESVIGVVMFDIRRKAMPKEI